MERLIDAVSYLTTATFLSLAAITVAQWRRHRTEAGRWAALTFGGLAGITLQSVVVDDTDGLLLQKLSIALLVLFPYCLYRFTTSFGDSRPLARVALGATVGVLIATAVVPELPNEDQLPAWYVVYLALLLTQWIFLSSLSAVLLWQAGRDQPTLPRRRMRTLSLAAAGMIVALLLASAGSVGAPSSLRLVVQLVALASAVGFFLGLAPPPSLRQMWRRSEQRSLQEATAQLMGATTVEGVTDVLLPHVAAMVGGQRAMLLDDQGTVIAAHGKHAPASSSRHADEVGPVGDREGAAACEAIELRPPFGSLQVWTTPYTPYFGRDDIGLLHSLGALADLALQRTLLLDDERELRLALEQANEQLRASNEELAREVAERKRGEEELREQADLLELTNDSIFVRDLDSTIRYWNRGAQETYGWRPEEVLGRPVHELLQTRFPQPLDDIMRELLANGRWEGELRHTGRDGSVIIASSRWALQRDGSGKPVAILETNNNITERKEAEHALVTAREAAEKANRAKSEFLSRMSHELRTPLNAILGFGQLLEMERLDPLQQESVAHVLKAGRHLLELIDEVLDIARIEAGHMTVSAEPVLVADVVAEAVDMVAPLASQGSIELDISADGAVFVVADRQRLKQVLLNLLSNAIKYNRHGGRVALSFSRPRPDRLSIDVRDTGRGIPEDKIDALFAPFERLGVEATDIEGTGLGLALSRNLVQVMGGQLEVSSTLGEGSTFSVQLPLTSDPMTSASHINGDIDSRLDPVPPGTKVLYIEDNLSNLRLIEQVLKVHSRARLLTALRGRMGLELARAHRPDVILLDLHLPDIPGEEVLRRLHEDEGTRDLPVVVISADATKSSIRRLLDQGATGYLTKPLDIPRFLDVVSEAIAERVR